MSVNFVGIKVCVPLMEVSVKLRVGYTGGNGNLSRGDLFSRQSLFKTLDSLDNLIEKTNRAQRRRREKVLNNNRTYYYIII